MRIAVDTNILIHLTNVQDLRRAPVRRAWRGLQDGGHELCTAPQNLIEFYSVATKPADRNGLGLLPSHAGKHLRFLEESLTLLREDERLFPAWKRVVLEQEVRGRQVHDARLAAIFRVHAISHVLTYDVDDFKRYQWLTALSPDEALENNL